MCYKNYIQFSLNFWPFVYCLTTCSKVSFQREKMSSFLVWMIAKLINSWTIIYIGRSIQYSQNIFDSIQCSCRFLLNISMFNIQILILKLEILIYNVHLYVKPEIFSGENHPPHQGARIEIPNRSFRIDHFIYKP